MNARDQAQPAPPRGVLFDYGDTLVRFTRPAAALSTARDGIVAVLAGAGLAAPTPDQLRRTVLDTLERAVAAHERRGALAEIDLTAEARRAYRSVGLDLSPALLDSVLRIEQEAWWQGASVDADAVPMLTALRHAGVRVGLCSNAPYRARSLHEQLAFVGLLAHLDSVTFSAEVGFRKPSPRIFEHALAALGTDAAHTVMVGDSELNDVDGAHAAGVRAILMRGPSTPPGATRADAVIDSLAAVPGALRDMGIY